MDLVIRNKVIDAPIRTILEAARRESAKFSLFSRMIDKGNNLQLTCPYHSGGHERRPSSFILQVKDDEETEYGTFHCFTCGQVRTLPQLIADIFEFDEKNAEEWLIDNFSGGFVTYKTFLPPIELDTKKRLLEEQKQQYLDESILNKYNFFHPYMYERKLTPEVIQKFQIGYDSERNAITFPVRDIKGNLVMITARSVASKTFFIDENKHKPVYLLNYCVQNNVSTVYVTESQINCLTLWGYGYPSIALIGTGSSEQYEILRKCGIRNYILCFDGDPAGYRGTQRFINAMPKSTNIMIKKIPPFKDVNDLTREEFDALPVVDSI